MIGLYMFQYDAYVRTLLCMVYDAARALGTPVVASARRAMDARCARAMSTSMTSSFASRRVRASRGTRARRTTTRCARAPPLDALELTRATRCARASNFVYKGDDVERFMAMDGFTLRARGVTGATGWAVCDDVASGERFVVVRGAAWNQPDTDRNKLSWQIAKAWPQKVWRSTPVVGHQGVLEMVEEFWGEASPWLTDETFTGTFRFAGHSLGGSMALVLAVRARLELGIEESRLASVCTFGAPPVLAYDRLSASARARADETVDADEILRILGFKRGASFVHQYVLAKDIIPRMWLSADPVFAAATSNEFIGGLLDWRRDVFGEGVLTKNRFLYESIGDLYWLEYASGEQGTPSLTRYDDDDVLKKLSMNLDDITESPLAALRTIGEHNSQSYVDALQFLTVREVINPGSQSNATP